MVFLLLIQDNVIWEVLFQNGYLIQLRHLATKIFLCLPCWMFVKGRIDITSFQILWPLLVQLSSQKTEQRLLCLKECYPMEQETQNLFTSDKLKVPTE